MSGLSDARLSDIRERANLQCGLDGDDADDLLAHIDRLSDCIAYARENLIANGAPQAASLVAGHVEGLVTPSKDWKHRRYSGNRGAVYIGLWAENQ